MKPIHFEIPISNPEKCLKFYENSFGWQFSRFGEMDYWLTRAGEDEEEGIAGAMIKKKGGEIAEKIDAADKAINTVITLNTDDLEAVIEKINQNGGQVMTEIMTIPEVGRHIYFQDLDGNLLGIMQSFPDRTM
jgi:predicted enzyme related to lactoylglutathione lyase